MEMTRKEIVEMGTVAYQMGVQDADELAEMIRFWVVFRSRADVAADLVREALMANRKASLALAAWGTIQTDRSL